MTTELRTEMIEALKGVRQEIDAINVRISNLEDIEETYPIPNTVQTVAEFNMFMQAARGVPAQIAVIENKIQKMEQSRSDKNKA